MHLIKNGVCTDCGTDDLSKECTYRPCIICGKTRLFRGGAFKVCPSCIKNQPKRKESSNVRS